MTRWPFSCSIVAASLAVLLLAGSLTAEDKPADKPQPKKPKSLMQFKLQYAEGVLEGLAVEDFEMIAKNAKAMNGVAELERWFKADSPRYKAQLQTFRFANEELIRLAVEKNLDGAALAYVQTTLSCVNCHKYVREQTE